MNKVKLLIKNLVGDELSATLGKIRSYYSKLLGIIFNTYKDGELFCKHSMVFNQNTFNKIESRIILHYHGLEKGFLHEDFKYRFAEDRIRELIKLLRNEEVCKNRNKSQIASAYLAICKYYEKHMADGIEISDYYKKEDYEYFKNLSILDLELTKEQNRTDFFNNIQSNFLNFANSRASVRSFTGEKISYELISKVIELAKTAPSVCNRQPIKVYYVDNKEKVERILRLQNGLTGYSNEISQLLILVADRNYFYSIGERNQLYIDGGIFLMNLLYALHYYEIGACPAHWAFNYKYDQKLQKQISLRDSEKVICLIPIGVPKEVFRTTLSLRRNNEEILLMVNDCS